MNWNESIDQYCERLGEGLWAEPLNAISNLSFIIAAVAAYMYGRELKAHRFGSYWLIFILLIIGVGSALFHTFANRWSMYTDIVPIFIFQLSYLWLYGAFLFKKSPQAGGFLLVTIFSGLNALMGLLPPESLNGSIIYLPALLMVLIVGVYHYRHAASEPRMILSALGFFTLSIIFRSYDQAICGSFSLGSHFVWHLLNGLMLYMLIRAYLNRLHAGAV